MKPFNQSLFCRLVIGHLVGKGDTTMDLPMKALFEIFASFAFMVFWGGLTVLLASLDALMGTNSFFSDLHTLSSLWSITVMFWAIWYIVVQVGGLILPWNEFTIGLLGVALTVFVAMNMFGTDAIRTWAAPASQQDYEELRIAILVCQLSATIPPTFGLWRAHTKL